MAIVTQPLDLEKFRAELDEVGPELFDIAMSIPKEDLLSDDEIRAEIAWRRGGIVILENYQTNRNTRHWRQ